MKLEDDEMIQSAYSEKNCAMQFMSTPMSMPQVQSKVIP